MRSLWGWALRDLIVGAVLYALAVFAIGLALAAGLGVCG